MGDIKDKIVSLETLKIAYDTNKQAINKLSENLSAMEPGGTIDDAQIQTAVNNYLEANPVQAGATAEQAEQIAKNTENINKLSGEKVNNPPTGSVGQILEIETVDESGKPKTYKAVNKPIGGGEVTDEQISNAVDNYMAANPIEESDPTVPEWAKQPEKPTYTASEVGAEPSGTAASKINEHNVSDTAHNDIRALIAGLTSRLNALADSDDTTLDQMSEVVAYIKSNKSLIDAITTSKVSVSDIIDNLTTNVANKPLSAAQGVALKALIDGILPSVTTADNGKFLRVFDGAWSAVALTDVSEVGA